MYVFENSDGDLIVVSPHSCVFRMTRNGITQHHAAGSLLEAFTPCASTPEAAERFRKWCRRRCGLKARRISLGPDWVATLRGKYGLEPDDLSIVEGVLPGGLLILGEGFPAT